MPFFLHSGSISFLCKFLGMAPKNLNIRPEDQDIHRQVKARAALEGVHMRDLVIRLFRAYLESPSPRPSRRRVSR